jgi:hypothetical protein
MDPLTCEERIRRGRGLIEHGNILRDRGPSETDGALEAYEAACALIAPLCSSETSLFRDDLASAWTNRGIALSAVGSASTLEQAVGCFDQAVKLRTPLIASDDPWFRYNLVGVWINRGDAQARLGHSRGPADAIHSYNEAIRIGQALDLGFRLEFSRRLALAHHNRGEAMVCSAERESLREACRSYEASLEILAATREGEGLLAASSWVGKSEALGRLGEQEAARTCARRSMELTSPFEPTHRDAALVGLKGRLALCASFSRELLRIGTSAGRKSEVAGGLDAADDGLHLALKWRSDTGFEPLARELFRFGSLAYAILQPQFLREFIQEFVALLGPQSETGFKLIAIEAVNEAIGRLAAKGIASEGLTGGDLDTFKDLREMSEHLGARDHPRTRPNP